MTIDAKTNSWAHNTIAKSQTCPMCLGPVVGHNTRKNGRVMLAAYQCEMSHQWNLTWVLAKAAA